MVLVESAGAEDPVEVERIATSPAAQPPTCSPKASMAVSAAVPLVQASVPE